MTIFTRQQADRLRSSLPLIALFVLMAGVGIVEPRFLQPDVLLQLADDTVVLMVLAVGVSFVIMLGGIDLSIQAMASLASVVMALTVSRLGYGAFPLAVLIGVLSGACAGVAHVKLKVPSFIATMAVGGVLAGMALLLSNERSISLVESQRVYLTWITGRSLGLPNSLFIGAALVAVVAVLQSRTRFGRYSAAIGAGEAAAYASGVRVDREKIKAFALSSGCAALAGVILASRLASGSPTLANELLLPAIAAVVVGGTAITGGVGSIWRTLVGALIISVVRTGMTFVGIEIFAQQIVFGVVLVVAVVVTIDRTKIPIVK
ncbi:ABC transporter permease [Mesorhizobium sp. XAP10]|uniref:ABC transporter permease n=1 Tax=unclassified Mesorhizobium TaxID=325217 RepID=UPI0023DE9504|nr:MULTISPECIES: ABC transporter permease [unclassified Mesorhizobium]MDF3154546.1 ABC transporter permease [Mesorhizobium sp. XAP10]MDF3247904.1 ABC transporter permease [Mesorhizobium sp. XAP4]